MAGGCSHPVQENNQSHPDNEEGTVSYGYPNIPEHLRKALDEYTLRHKPTGGLLQAIIEDRLTRAVTLAAHDITIEQLREMVWYAHNEMPSPAHNFVAWTTCVCKEGKSTSRFPAAACLVHAWPEEMVRAAL